MVSDCVLVLNMATTKKKYICIGCTKRICNWRPHDSYCYTSQLYGAYTKILTTVCEIIVFSLNDIQMTNKDWYFILSQEKITQWNSPALKLLFQKSVFGFQWQVKSHHCYWHSAPSWLVACPAPSSTRLLCPQVPLLLLWTLETGGLASFVQPGVDVKCVRVASLMFNQNPPFEQQRVRADMASEPRWSQVTFCTGISVVGTDRWHVPQQSIYNLLYK